MNDIAKEIQQLQSQIENDIDTILEYEYLETNFEETTKGIATLEVKGRNRINYLPFVLKKNVPYVDDLDDRLSALGTHIKKYESERNTSTGLLRAIKKHGAVYLSTKSAFYDDDFNIWLVDNELNAKLFEPIKKVLISKN